MSAVSPRATIWRDPWAFAAAASKLAPRAPGVPRGVFLVAPSEFSLAAESATDNRYMRMSQDANAQRAGDQHQSLAQTLATHGIPVMSFPGSAKTPDAVFPNNVFATAPGIVVVGAMRHTVRRREAERSDIRSWFRSVLGYREIDLSVCACVAELTGSLVIDRARGIGFCGLSDRCDEAGARAMASAFGLAHMLLFDLADGEYHTNVIMSALAGRGVLMCPAGFAEADVPAAIATIYPGASISIDDEEKASFVGNCIALGEDGLWMSATAADALKASTRDAISALGLQIHAVQLDEFEKAGGSLRCMIGELY